MLQVLFARGYHLVVRNSFRRRLLGDCAEVDWMVEKRMLEETKIRVEDHVHMSHAPAICGGLVVGVLGDKFTCNECALEMTAFVAAADCSAKEAGECTRSGAAIRGRVAPGPLASVRDDQ